MTDSCFSPFHQCNLQDNTDFSKGSTNISSTGRTLTSILRLKIATWLFAQMEIRVISASHGRVFQNHRYSLNSEWKACSPAWTLAIRTSAYYSQSIEYFEETIQWQTANMAKTLRTQTGNPCRQDTTHHIVVCTRRPVLVGYRYSITHHKYCICSARCTKKSISEASLIAKCFVWQSLTCLFIYFVSVNV